MGSNGIYQHATIDAQDIDITKIKFLNDIVALISRYNEEELKNA